MSKMTVREFLSLKGKRTITAVNVEDIYLVSACVQAGVDNIVLGGITSVEEKLRLLQQTRKEVPEAFITAAIPLSSSVVSDAQALRDATALVEGGADLIYVTGMRPERIKVLAREHIPCVGHLGLVPYFSTWIGGFRSVGKTLDEAKALYDLALELNDAGAVCAEVECVPERLAAFISSKVSFITYSMGSGNGCDGQYLFSCDLLGLNNGHYPRHSVCYDDFYGRAVKAFCRFKQDAATGAYPAREHIIPMDEDVFEQFLNSVE